MRYHYLVKLFGEDGQEFGGRPFEEVNSSVKHCEKEKYKVGGVGDEGTEFTTSKSRVNLRSFGESKLPFGVLCVL